MSTPYLDPKFWMENYYIGKHSTLKQVYAVDRVDRVNIFPNVILGLRLW